MLPKYSVVSPGTEGTEGSQEGKGYLLNITSTVQGPPLPVLVRAAEKIGKPFEEETC